MATGKKGKAKLINSTLDYIRASANDLYHMGNYGSGYWNNTPDDHMPSVKNEEWWINRNNQRVGVAVADDLNGEWKRFDKPLIYISGDLIMTSTPVASQRLDGKFLIVYKFVTKGTNCN